jgi:hypothetical protein
LSASIWRSTKAIRPLGGIREVVFNVPINTWVGGGNGRPNGGHSSNVPLRSFGQNFSEIVFDISKIVGQLFSKCLSNILSTLSHIFGKWWGYISPTSRNISEMSGNISPRWITFRKCWQHFSTRITFRNSDYISEMLSDIFPMRIRIFAGVCERGKWRLIFLESSVYNLAAQRQFRADAA